MHPVDDSTAIPPSLRRTWFISLVLSLWNKYVPSRKLAGETIAEVDQDDIDESQSGTEEPGSGTVTPKEGANGLGSKAPGRAAATSMAGGRRRKAVRKK